MKNLKVILLFIFGANLFGASKDELSKICQDVYIYAYPMVLMEVTKNVSTLNNIYINRFLNMLKFPDDRFKSIVRPNVDTLYSSAWLDLSKEPLILSVPDTKGRYYLLEMMDAWTNVFESIGKRTTGTEAQNFLLVGPSYEGKLHEGMQVIKAPTNIVWILGRTQTNGKSDYKFVNKIQKNFRITQLSHWPQIENNNIEYSKIDLLRTSPEETVVKMNAKQFYRIFLTSLKKNPASNDDSLMLKNLELLGLKLNDAGELNLPKQTLDCLTKAMRKGIVEINNNINKVGKQVNGWNIALDVGDYSNDYLTRAIVAKIGIGANLPEDAVYPTAFVDSQGQKLNGMNRYLIHFDKDNLPPANAFWSLTLYDDKSFLVPNMINRYALGDRDNLKYNQDGSLVIFIQRQPPNKNNLNNWLPAPNGNFNLTMRIYWPKESVLNGSWLPPLIKKI